MSMSSDLSSAEDAVDEALLVIRALRMSLEAMPLDERRKFVRRWRSMETSLAWSH